MAAHLTQISQLLGGSMPGRDDALSGGQSQPAVAASAAKAVAAAPAPQAPVPAATPAARHSAGAQTDKAASNGKQGEGEDEWWTE